MVKFSSLLEIIIQNSIKLIKVRNNRIRLTNQIFKVYKIRLIRNYKIQISIIITIIKKAFSIITNNKNFFNNKEN